MCVPPDPLVRPSHGRDPLNDRGEEGHRRGRNAREKHRVDRRRFPSYGEDSLRPRGVEARPGGERKGGDGEGGRTAFRRDPPHPIGGGSPPPPRPPGGPSPGIGALQILDRKDVAGEHLPFMHLRQIWGENVGGGKR